MFKVGEIWLEINVGPKTSHNVELRVMSVTVNVL